MQTSAAEFQFTAEIIVFLAALAGLALLLLRSELLTGAPGPRLGLAAGFACLGAAGFLQGAIETDPSSALVAGLRVGAAVLLVGGSAARWVGGALGAWLVRTGAAAVAVGAVVDLSGSWPARTWAAESLVAVGALGVAGALWAPSRRSIGVRLAASAAATLLLIIVVLAAALSTVLSDTVSKDAISRLDANSRSAAAQLGDAWVTDLRDAKVVTAAVESLGSAPAAATSPAALTALQGDLAGLSSQFFSDVGLLWVAPGGRVLATSPGFDAGFGPQLSSALAGSSLVAGCLASSRSLGADAVAAGRAVAAGCFPYSAPGGAVGAAVAVTPLDTSFLANLARGESQLSLALTDAAGELASYPPRASLPSTSVTLGRRALSGGSASATVANHFVIARAVVNRDASRPLAVVAALPTAVFDQARQSLFQTLFLIALAAALFSFLLSVLISERINRGLLALTTVARRISSGETRVRTRLSSEDEIGTLAGAFDTMAEAIEDKTEALRRAAEEEAVLRGRLESVVAGMGEAVVAVAEDGTVTDFNRAAEALFGQRRARVLGRPVGAGTLRLTTRDGGDLGRLLAEVTRMPFSLEAEVTGRDGPVPVAVTLGRVGGVDGGAGGAVAVIRDLRRELEVERMKTEFLSRVGHELRTPLTAILGYAQLLTRRRMAPEQAATYNIEIVEQSRRLLRIVEMLEFFAGVAANRIAMNVEPVTARSLVEEIAARWQAKDLPSHRITARVRRGVPTLSVDRRWMLLALDELVDNAVKFSPSGGPVILEVSAEASGGVRLSVRDRGKGMTTEVLAAAFQEFGQGDTSDTRDFGGLGLGLGLVRQVAEGHGGRVEMESEPGSGTLASIVLPVPGSRRRA
ncbi:MAG TPA: ATP-binding protein [Acidimicrobiales bacterium]|nr:ATP-binding protein [Acidimicrobiales bacterium]